VGLVGQLVDAGQHVDGVFQIMETPVGTGPHDDQALAGLADGLDGRRAADGLDGAEIGG
jgi:hypothetical protein